MPNGQGRATLHRFVLLCATSGVLMCLVHAAVPRSRSRGLDFNAEQNVLTELKVRFDDLGHFLLKMCAQHPSGTTLNIS